MIPAFGRLKQTALLPFQGKPRLKVLRWFPGHPAIVETVLKDPKWTQAFMSSTWRQRLVNLSIWGQHDVHGKYQATWATSENFSQKRKENKPYQNNNNKTKQWKSWPRDIAQCVQHLLSLLEALSVISIRTPVVSALSCQHLGSREDHGLQDISSRLCLLFLLSVYTQDSALPTGCRGLVNTWAVWPCGQRRQGSVFQAWEWLGCVTSVRV